MLRVWIAEGKLHCSMKIGMYLETMNVPEERAWGGILADATRHIANALESGYSENRGVSIEKIKESYLKAPRYTHLRSPIMNQGLTRGHQAASHRAFCMPIPRKPLLQGAPGDAPKN
ncbi:DUF5076 domain-containing protein [Ralstonia pseudosolanacearum]|nr:DUF5076 domain-containing protein [Ralstonia pseudosolanacearum]